MFAQTLEGPFDGVQATFERIQLDHRHEDVVLLQADTVAIRTFGDWAMARAEPKDPARAKQILAEALANGADRASDHVVALLATAVRARPAPPA